jgi:hypothetical protein
MKRDRNPHLPPMNRVPRNVAGLAILEIEEYSVNNWHPLADGKGLPTQVHLVFKLRGIAEPLVLRLKSARAADQLIAILERHRNDVWPTPAENAP